MRSGNFTVETFGGLGNQLFQYALGRRLCRAHQCELYFDTWWNELPGNRSFQLDFLSAFYAGALPRSSPTVAKIRLRLAVRQPMLLETLAPNTITEKGLPFRAEVLAAKPGSRLIGYFQSWQYFADVLPQIKQEIMLSAPRAAWVANAARALDDQPESVAIHVRRGDYETRRAQRYHGVLGKDYYRRAIEALNPGRRTKYFLFSDSDEAISLVAELIGCRSDIQIVREPEGSTPLDVLLLMASFPAIICANSTFSWWAAFLGSRSNKNVVVPAAWFQSKQICQGSFFLPTWNAI